MKIEPSSLDKLLQEFEWNVLDFESTLLTLECLKFYWDSQELQQRYSQDVLLQARHDLSSYLTQYTQDLSNLAASISSRCTGRA